MGTSLLVALGCDPSAAESVVAPSVVEPAKKVELKEAGSSTVSAIKETPRITKKILTLDDVLAVARGIQDERSSKLQLEEHDRTCTEDVHRVNSRILSIDPGDTNVLEELELLNKKRVKRARNKGQKPDRVMMGILVLDR